MKRASNNLYRKLNERDPDFQNLFSQYEGQLLTDHEQEQFDKKMVEALKNPKSKEEIEKEDKNENDKFSQNPEEMNFSQPQPHQEDQNVENQENLDDDDAIPLV